MIPSYDDPSSFEAFPGVPRYFKRFWSQPGPYSLCPPGGVTIYGYSARSPYAEDHSIENAGFATRRVFPTISFSTLEINGEYGAQPLDAVEEISEAQFLLARDRGWAT